MKINNYKNGKVIISSSTNMKEIESNSVSLIITSPPYYNIKDYSMNGTQDSKHTERNENEIGSQNTFNIYIKNMLKVWKECERVLKPNGKLCINVPLMPILKKEDNSQHTRKIYDLQSEIQNSILKKTNMNLFDLYIWNRVNSSKKLMFGSYPYPGNLYAQNTSEFITVYVKPGKPKLPTKEIKEVDRITQKEWVEYTKQIWDIPSPNKGTIGFGEHTALMPEEIPYRLIKMFSFSNDVILDPFTGSGTTLKVAKELNRKYVGYELYESYLDLIERKIDDK